MLDDSKSTRPSVRRALLVDDDALVLSLQRRFFEYLGIETVSASTSADALQKLEASDVPFDLAIIDFSLPDKDGGWLCTQIRALSPITSLVLSSGNRPEELGVDGEQSDWDKFLAKPFTLCDVKAVVLPNSTTRSGRSA